MTDKDKVKLTIYLDAATRDKAHQLRKQTGRSISFIVRQAILRWEQEALEEAKRQQKPDR